MRITNADQLGQVQRQQMTTLDEFLETGKSEITYAGHPIVRDNAENVLIIKKRIVYEVGEFEKTRAKPPRWELHCSWSGLRDPMSVCEAYSGVIVPSTVTGQEFMLLINGDGDGEYVVEPKAAELATTLSFDCIAELLSPRGHKVLIGLSRLREYNKAARQVAERKLRVVAVTSDETRQLAAAAKSQLSELLKKRIPWNKARLEIKPPEAGLTLVGGTLNAAKWHRSATILLTNGTKTFLIGQDEGTYFGCELGDNPKSVKAAYESLMPAAARNKTGVYRQGEWFAIPVPAKSVPAAETCLAVCEEDDSISFPKDHPDSNSHTLAVDSGEVRIGTSGIFATGSSLDHSEHATLRLPKKQWFTFARNTARRSVSQQGVD
jgi:hypothetical protein